MILPLGLLSALALAGVAFGLRAWEPAKSPRQPGRPLGERLEAWARGTGTGLSFREILTGALLWVLGFATVGLLAYGPLTAPLLALAGAGIYLSSLEGRRQEYVLEQARDLEKGMGLLALLLEQGLPLYDALAEAAQGCGRVGERMLRELAESLAAAPPEGQGEAVRRWAARWPGPAAAVAVPPLLAAVEGRLDPVPALRSLRATLGETLAVLGRARAEARGIEWQARFLAIWPPLAVAAFSLLGIALGRSPVFLLPALLGSAVSFLLTHREIARGLSVEAALGRR